MIRIGLAFVVFFFASGCFQERGLSLIAKEVVPVYETLETAMSLPPKKKIAELQAQQEVKVLKCIDVKHYLVYKVRLSDGEIGFINEGEYILFRDGK